MLRALWRSIFGKTPVPGEVYIFDYWDDGNPFRRASTGRVVVKAVRNGWVNYRHFTLVLGQNESMKQSSFLFSYKREDSS